MDLSIYGYYQRREWKAPFAIIKIMDKKILNQKALTDEEIEKDIIGLAFLQWKARFKVKAVDVDDEFQGLYNDKIFRWLPKEGSVLKKARQAQLYSLSYVSSKTGIGAAAISKLEKREAEGNITLLNMQKIAEALDCELIVGIRPKNLKSFSEVLWNRILPLVKANPKYAMHVFKDKDRRRAGRAWYVAEAVERKSREIESMKELKISHRKFQFSD